MAIDVLELKSAAMGRELEVLEHVAKIPRDVLDGKHHACPSCGGKDRFRMIDSAKGAVLCNQCFNSNNGDFLAAIEHYRAVDFPTAAKLASEYLGLSRNGHAYVSAIAATYDYCDENGELLFQVCRYEPGKNGARKYFRQRRPDGNGGWEWTVKGVRHVPYRLPELLADTTRLVVVVEGEKDVDNLTRIGMVATCNSGGAGKWTGEHAKFLANRDVVVIADRDTPGRKHAEQVAKSLQGVAKSVRILELPIGKDASDWIDAGGTYEELVAIASAAQEWTPKWTTTCVADAATTDLRLPEGRTEAANAKRLVARFGDQIRWCDPWNKWLVWDGKRWKIDDDRRIDALAKTVANDLWQEAWTLAKATDDATKKAMFKYVHESNQANSVRNMIYLSRCEVAILPILLDAHPWLLNVENGTLDLRTGTLRPHDRNDYLTQLCPVPYEPAAKFPMWRNFIDFVLGGNRQLIVYVQRLVGVCLTGSTREHLLPFLFGVGANGKSTIISTLLAMLGPDYAMKAPADLLLAKGNTHPTERADLYGKRFVACVEAEDGRRIAESLVKELTGGDRVRARRMREDFWEFQATHKIWLAANHKPVVRGTDHGIWRRIKLLPFTVTIPDDQQDKDLPAKLLDELPGILAWAVEGCRQWLKDGLREPDCVRVATGSYREEMDLVGRFIAECCVVEHDASVGATALYTSFKTWCEVTGERGLNQTRFGAQMTERGFNSGKVGGGRVVRYGIRLIGDDL